MITFDEILKLDFIKIINVDSPESLRFTGVSIDSRTVKNSELFFAVKGENTDGHIYLEKIFTNKIKLAVVNEKWYRTNYDKFSRNSFVIVKDTILALGQLANIHKRRFNIPVLCIGGSNGKTTTKDIIISILSQKYNILGTAGNFNNHIGLPLTLLGLNKNHNFAVLEVGSNHFNEIKYLCRIAEPDFGLITNIGREHLEFFKNISGAAREELELFKYLDKQKRDTVCFVNKDDKYITKFSTKLKNTNLVTYSYKYKADFKGRFLSFDKDFNPHIEVSSNRKKFKSKISAFGYHSIYNGLSAVAVGLYFDIPVRKIQNALTDLCLKNSNRMGVIKKKRYIIINDTYNSNPDSVMLGLKSVKEFKIKGKKHLIIGDMLELGGKSTSEHLKIGKEIKKMGFKNLYTYGRDSYNIFIGAGGLKNNFYFQNKTELIAFVKKIIKKDDMVYVKGSRGMKMEDIINGILKQN